MLVTRIALQALPDAGFAGNLVDLGSLFSSPAERRLL